MRKGLRYTILIFLSLLFTLMAATAWLFWTPSGARTALAALSRFSSLQIEAAGVTGRLADRLRLQGVRVRWQDNEAEAANLLLDWHPGALLGGRLAVEKIALTGVEVHTHPAEKQPTAPSLALPEIGGAGRYLQAEIKSLQVDSFILRPGTGESVTVNRFAARLAWRNGVFTVAEMQVAAPRGRLAGDMSLDLGGPALRADLQAEPASAPADIRTVALHLDLHPGPAAREMTGPLRLSARSADQERLQLTGQVDWSRDRLALSSLRLTDPAGKGEAGGEVAIVAGQDWHFDLHLRLAGLDLAPETGTHTEISGALQASGSLQDFQGNVSLANRVPGWRNGSLSAPFQGNRQQIVLPSLQGEWLRGRLEGSLTAGWGEGWKLQADLRGQGLDPAAIAPDWSGRINFTLRTAARGGAQEPLAAEVNAWLLESTLRGRPLTGNIAASLQGEDLNLSALSLHGDDFTVKAQGKLQERIDFNAEVSRLAGLLPDARGSLTARGWTRWRDKHLSGKLVASGRHLAVAGGRVARLSLEAEHREKGTPVAVKADLAGVVFRDWRLDRAGLRMRGTVEEHSLQLTLAGPEVQLRAAASGGYDGKGWGGRITSLKTGGQRFGRWSLASPTALRIAGSQLKISPFRLQGEGKEFLQAEADLAFSPRRGRIRGEWQELDLRRANPWVRNVSLAGRSSGSARIEWLPGDRLDLQGRAQLAGSFSRSGRRMEIRTARAELAWGPGGMQAAWEADLGGTGALSGRATSGLPARLGVPAAGEGEAHWQVKDLAALSPWLPGVRLDGRSSGEVSGRWREDKSLAVKGRAELSGHVAYQQRRLTVRQAKAQVVWDQKGLAADLNIDLGEGGRSSGHLTSAEPARLALPHQGDLQARWQGVDLSLLSPWLPETEIAGHSSGTVDASWQQSGGVELDGRLDLAARLKRDRLSLDIRHGEAAVKWNGDGLRGSWTIGLAPAGSLAGEIRSAAPARLALPERGSLRVQWEQIDLALLRPWMPSAALLEGSLAGRTEGEWLPGQNLRLTGTSEVNRGELQWEGESGVITAALRQAKFDWNWQGDNLRGDMTLALEHYGRAEGTFQLPLPARLPTAMEPSGPVRGRLTADLQEEGLLNAFLPGLVQESSGKLGLDLRLAGIWQKPELGGEVRLADAGAYLPTAGVRLEKVQLLARLNGQEIRVESFRAQSGSGNIEGTGSVQLHDWQLAAYQLQVKGKDFRVINLPEMQMQVSPDLTIEGSRSKLAVHGEVQIPQMLVTGKETRAPVQPSTDVVIVNAPQKPERTLPLELDVRVRIVLGKHVLVKAQGADARLEGELRLIMTGLSSDKITAQGEIKVAQGKYAAYGINLDITRGAVLFAGGPVDRPTLDILALKTIGDVKAGVRVTGTPRQPEVKLYSEPAMPDTDVLAYIVLGHPLGQGAAGGNTDLMMVAAGALLSKGESAVLQDRLKRRLGIDVLQVESGSGDVASSRITIGKYLNPDLYISFGQSLFSNTQEAQLRYNLTKRWQLESSAGAQSAVDLYYQIKFR